MAEKKRQHVAVVGAGWAGCAAAAALCRNGHAVTLFEAARALGGRARGVQLNGRALDNGQHILLGAYSETLGLMRLAGIAPQDAFLRLPLQMCYPSGSGIEFIARRLPAPLHLATALVGAHGLDRQDKLSLARFITAARWMDWHLDTDCTVDELLVRFDQTERLYRFLWRPLCLAALNTAPIQASAKVFLAVLRDSLGARRGASDMLIPRIDLSALLPDAVETMLTRHGSCVLRGTRVHSIAQTEDGLWQIQASPAASQSSAHRFDDVIVATSAPAASRLLSPHMDTELLDTFQHESIATCYLQYSRDLRLPRPFLALADDPSLGHWGQYIFDRGQLDTAQAGLMAVVVSAATDALEKGHQDLLDSVAMQLSTAFRNPALSTPEWSAVISEKRATFSCRPGVQRPDQATGLPGLWIAGDFTAGDYPSTLEGAVRSGLRAASLIMASEHCITAGA